jgi:hypothetical protein
MPNSDDFLNDDELLLDEESSEGVVAPPLSPAALPPVGGKAPVQTRVLLFTRPEESTAPQITLLWPAWGWRVAAPQRNEGTLDFLQLTALRLAAAGVFAADEQSRLLKVDKGVLGQVRGELERRSFVDTLGRVTEPGREALEADGRHSEEDAVYGWVFREGLVGELVPYFHSGRLRFAAAARPDVQFAWELPWPAAKPHQPSAVDVIEAAQRHRQLAESARAGVSAAPLRPPGEGGSSEPPDPRPTTAAPSPASAAGARILSAQPQCFSLAVRATLEGFREGRLSLECPFGLPMALRWAGLLHFAASQSPQVAEVLARLQAESRRHWQEEQPGGLDPLGLARDAADAVRAEMKTPPSDLWQPAWEELEGMERSRILVERGFPEADAVLTRAQRALEAVFLTWLRLDPPPWQLALDYIAGDSPVNLDDLRERLLASAVSCGTPAGHVPELVVQTRPGSILQAMQFNGGSLRPYVAALLLSATRRRSLHHRTLCAVMSKRETLLDDLEVVAGARNTFGAHHSRTGQAPADLARRAALTTYQISRLVVDACRMIGR